MICRYQFNNLVLSIHNFQGVCREILCKEGRQYADKICKRNSNQNDRECREVYLRIKPTIQIELASQDYVLLHELESEKYLAEFHDKVTKLMTEDSDVIQEFYVFTDLEKVFAAGGKVEELVVYMLLDIPIEKETEIIQNYQQLGMNTVGFSRGTKIVSFFMTIELFNISRSSNPLDNRGAEIHVLNNDGTNNATFGIIYDKLYGERTCLDNNTEILQYSSITFCPHIKIGTSEFVVRIENGVLLLIDNESVLDQYPNWNYELHNDSIHLCLKDYSEINFYMRVPLLPVKPAFGSSGELFDPKHLLKNMIFIGLGQIFLKLF